MGHHKDFVANVIVRPAGQPGQPGARVRCRVLTFKEVESGLSTLGGSAEFDTERCAKSNPNYFRVTYELRTGPFPKRLWRKFCLDGGGC